jgi:15-cis-phytoene synthase
MTTATTRPAVHRLALYDDTANRAADVVVRGYSTSFGLATRLLPTDQRTQVRNIYALVRLADEVVDGASSEAGADKSASRAHLDGLEWRTEAALRDGYSTDVLVHAFARTAREAGFSTELTRPFFASMRTDLDIAEHDAVSLREYVYGSAEVVGLMCLRVFLLEEPAERRAARYTELASGAQSLGAAFQKINFLRDLAEDSALGRRYLDLDPAGPAGDHLGAVLQDIAGDLAVARAALPDLPTGARRAVAVAYGLFHELTARIAATPAEQLTTTRVRVPGPVKARIAATAMWKHGPGRVRHEHHGPNRVRH